MVFPAARRNQAQGGVIDSYVLQREVAASPAPFSCCEARFFAWTANYLRSFDVFAQVWVLRCVQKLGQAASAASKASWIAFDTSGNLEWCQKFAF